MTDSITYTWIPGTSLKVARREIMIAALRHCQGNKIAAARLLGINRNVLTDISVKELNIKRVIAKGSGRPRSAYRIGDVVTIPNTAVQNRIAGKVRQAFTGPWKSGAV